jgi:hypothetical protein
MMTGMMAIVKTITVNVTIDVPIALHAAIWKEPR